MNQAASTLSTPLICSGPATDAAVAAMSGLNAAQGIDLTQLQPLAVKVQQWVTPEGARVSFTPAHERPMFDLALRFRAGSVLDGDNPGLAALVLYSLDQGTKQLDSARFAQFLEGHGAIMNRSINHDEAVVTLRCLSLPALRASVLSLFTQMLAQPALRPDDVARIRERLAIAQRARAWYPSTRKSDATMAHVFADHPYAIPVTGTAEGLDGITDQQLRAFHQRAYSANNVDIGLVGDLSPAEAHQLVADLVQALPQNWAAQLPDPSPAPNAHTTS
ncbi:insulinase family protein [Pseudomonas sp. BW16M2]|nr:insulinase family protein [Pseudomonas sp. BW16M2]MBC3433903.1 insulinase family protein [Pseudomonas sp. BW16M2]